MPLVRINNKVMYFSHIPKCAGSSVEGYLKEVCDSIAFLDRAYLSHPPETKWNISSPQHIDGISLLRLFQDRDFFDEYFAIVRHPISRFKSAFKFQIEVERKIPPSMSINDLVKELYKAGISRIKIGWMDNHFMPMAGFFVPGPNYQVFKLEDGLEKFQQWFEKKANIKESQINIGKKNAAQDRKQAVTIDDQLSDESKQMLFEMYQKDFELFNYSEEP